MKINAKNVSILDLFTEMSPKEQKSLI